MPSHDVLPTERPPRWAVLDGARGIAVAAMVVYHAAWDLSFLRLISTDVVASPAWSLFARTIAATFLLLAGFGLALAHGESFRPRPFLRRLAVIAGAALLVTAGTAYAFPETFVTFGILHCLAVSSVLALPFLRAPLLLVGLAAVASFAAPSVLAAPVFDAPALRWTGLGTVPPATVDWVPVLPWFGSVLAGVAAGRIARSRLKPAGGPAGGIARLLAWTGRHNLPIYLLHQPAIFAVLLAAAELIGPSRVERDRFLGSCEASCNNTGRDRVACASACRCVADRAADERLWSPMIRGRLDERGRERVLALTGACFGAPSDGGSRRAP